MNTSTEVNQLVAHCMKTLEFDGLEPSNACDYSHIPLCVIDSVFSIGVRYEGVENVIRNTCSYFEIDAESHAPSDTLTTSGFLERIASCDAEFLANNVFKNRQRTSSKKGILKAQAVILFLEKLREYGVETRDDICKIATSSAFEDDIKGIPGQGSGISMKYFFMLAGDDNLIKPDRMIVGFLRSALGRTVAVDECQELLTKACEDLRATHKSLTPSALDHLIWRYQRSKSKRLTVTGCCSSSS